MVQEGMQVAASQELTRAAPRIKEEPESHERFTKLMTDCRMHKGNYQGPYQFVFHLVKFQ